MSGTINSLGLGSGVLTSDLIDKLRANDEGLILKPLDNKITLNQQKTQVLDLLSTLLNSFKSSVGALDDDTLYQKRSVSGNNDGVSVSAAAGSQIRDFSLEITNIAKKNVLQSGTFTAPTDKIATGTGILNLNIAGANYKIDYTSTTTLSDLKDKINESAGSASTASILQTGKDAYSLVITSKATGKEQTISLTDLSGSNNFLNNNLESKGLTTGAFTLGEDDLIATDIGNTGDLAITVDGTEHKLSYDDTTTLKQMVDKINADTTLSSKLSASIVAYGTSDYRMVLTPKEQTLAISLSDKPSVGTGLLSAMTSTTAKNGTIKVVQDGQDASFKFDGISMTRSTNTISDIATGLTLNLLKDGGSSNISITQNRDQIATEMESMVSSYNTLIKQLDDMTTYDAAEGKVGIFNGNNTIKNISREITQLITSVDSKGFSLPKYGIDLNREGVMSFNKATFMEKMDADPTGTESFFSGKTTVSATDVTTIDKGVFTSLNDLVKRYTSSSSGLLYNLTTASKAETTSLNEEHAKATKLLEARYATMQAKFAAYDSMISKLNNQFSSLKQQIDAMAYANK